MSERTYIELLIANATARDLLLVNCFLELQGHKQRRRNIRKERKENEEKAVMRGSDFRGHF